MNLTLKSKMALAVSLLFILFSTAMTWFTLAFFHEKFEKALTEQQAALTGAISLSIENKLGMARTAMNGATARITPAVLADPAAARDYLNSRPTLQAIFDDGLFLFSPTGRLVAESSYISPHPPHHIARFEELCATTAAAARTQITTYRFDSRTPGVFFSVPVLDQSGRMYAILAGGIDLHGKSFIEEISRLRIGQTGYLYICDADGDIIVHQHHNETTQPLPERTKELIGNAAFRMNGTGITTDSRLGEMITSYRRLPTTGWIVVANLPRSEALAPLFQARHYFIAATALGTATILLMAWFLMKRLMGPLQGMIRHCSGASERPGEERFYTVESHDEIGTLAHAFNGMVASLNSQQKQLEAAAVQAENERARAEAIIAAIGTGLSIQDRQFRILYQNRIHQEIKGDQCGRLCFEAYEKKEAVCGDCPIAMVFSDGAVHSVEKWVDEGGKIIEIVASPLRNATGEIIAAIEIVRDITARKRTEEEIRELNDILHKKALELELSNAEEKAFGYSLSHDLKAPLTRISLAAQTLGELYGDRLDEVALYCIETISSGSSRMDEMIDGMLLLSRISRQDLTTDTVDLSAAVKDIADRLGAEHPDRTVKWSIEPGISAQGDQRLLKSVLENLVGNAWKYTGRTEDAQIEFGTVPFGEGTAIFVRDNGAGFDAASSETIFKPFHRLHDDAEFKGSGIGLATVQRIIQRHGGRIWAEGEPGNGATFYFTIPPAGC